MTFYAIGEVLVDMIPLQKGRALKDVVSFERSPGGAPANVAAAISKFGGESYMISQVGEDAFGDFLVEQLSVVGVKTDKILRTNEANTALAWVSLREDGERDFSFYRNPSADMLYSEDQIEGGWFKEGDILHFCSVDLIDCPMKEAHQKAIKLAKKNNTFISFDPNVRLPLWDNPTACREAILEFIPQADLLKISDEELEFITGLADEQKAIYSLFVGSVKAIIYTKGADGAVLYVKNQSFTSKGFCVQVQDTTGAGDAFIGGFLYQLYKHEVTVSSFIDFCINHHDEALTFANASGALTTTGKGAIGSLPTKEQINDLILSKEKEWIKA